MTELSISHSSNASGEIRKTGLTLIELLVVIAILAVVGGIIAASLAGGIRVLDTARRFNRLEGDCFIGMAMFEKDVVNSVPFFDIAFDGESQELSFPVLLGAPDDDGDTRIIGTIKYFFHPATGKLFKKEWPFPDAEPQAEGSWQEIVANIKVAYMDYYQSPDADNRGEWLSVWKSETNFPGAVRITISMDDGANEVLFRRSVMMPLAKGDGK